MAFVIAQTDTFQIHTMRQAQKRSRESAGCTRPQVRSFPLLHLRHPAISSRQVTQLTKPDRHGRARCALVTISVGPLIRKKLRADGAHLRGCSASSDLWVATNCVMYLCATCADITDGLSRDSGAFMWSVACHCSSSNQTRSFSTLNTFPVRCIRGDTVLTLAPPPGNGTD